MNWVITLIAINILISLLSIYLSLKKGKGNKVLEETGRRGEEGDPLCNFCH